MMQYIWLARSRPMRHLLVAWCVCYAGDLAAFTAASVYAMIMLAFADTPYWPYLAFEVIGVANVVNDVGVYSSLQQVIPPRLMGRALQSATYESGDVIIREGEPGERFYMIVEGRARASKDGRLLNELAAPGSFGEIALLRRIPRVVTIRLEARILAREEFLAAVTGNPESVEKADEVVSTWLGSC